MWTLLASALLGSFHCAGMCGGFVLALDAPGLWLRRLGVQGLFHLGKGMTYVLLGSVLGLAGSAVLRSPWFLGAQAVLAVLAGGLMVVFGLQILGVVRELPVGSWFGPESAYGRAFRAVLNLRGPAAPLATGALTGLLPCPLVYAFLAEALRRANLLESMSVMAILALGSLPALLAVVVLGSRLGPALRRRFVRVAGVAIVLLGLVTLLRGLFPEWLHAGPHAEAPHAH